MCAICHNSFICNAQEMHQRLYRCASDIQFDDSPVQRGKIVQVKLKPFSETCNYLQYQKPLTPEHPCFFARIISFAPNSSVSIGIAGPDIEDDVHPGNWNNSVGYQNSGSCYTSHYLSGNTKGKPFCVGDVFGVLVTYFGKDMSTVMFLNNSVPVATRYLFEPDHTRFLPTVALENGPIELGLLWPEAVEPNISKTLSFPVDFVSRWICPAQVSHDSTNNVYTCSDPTSTDTVIQCPLPLSNDIHHFEVIVHEVSDDGAGPTIGIATCSPLIPTPTCPILNDYFKWHPDGKLLKISVGQRMGWGIHYDPKISAEANFDHQMEQLVLCYVSMNVKIVYAKMMIQPTGGWYPICVLHPYASKVQVDMTTNPRPVITKHLDELFTKLAPEARNLIEEDKKNNFVGKNMLRKSSAIEVSTEERLFHARLPKDKKGIHVLQLTKPLTPKQSYFQVSVKSAGDTSVVCVGIAAPTFPLNRYPGRLQNTVGYHSRDGKFYYNDKENGNMMGKRFGKGDAVGLEVEVFEKRMSIVLANKNGLPIGTRYLTETNHDFFLPTIAICGNGSEVTLDVVWQNQVLGPPVFDVTNIGSWCLPEGARVDLENDIVQVDEGHQEAEAIQAPYSLHRTYNHFEVELIDDFDEEIPPPAIALCTASPFDPTPKSNFKQDFIRFWATGEAQKAVEKGDLMGWGMLYPDSTTPDDEEQLVICYLTINRNVALTRVMYQPPGGFYPVVLLPPGVNRIKLNFEATLITDHPFTDEAVEKLIKEAKQMIEEEERHLASGVDPEDWDNEENKAKYLKPLPRMKTGRKAMGRFQEAAELELMKQKSGERIANLVELMIQQEHILKDDQKDNGKDERSITDMKPDESSRVDKTVDTQGSGRPQNVKESKMCRIL